MADKPATPFEWLSGGLFFGKSKGAIENIDSCKDPLALVKGIAENLPEMLSMSEDDAVDASTTTSGEHKPTPSQFLAARLSRLRFLLYDERRVSSQEPSKRHRPTVANATLQGFVSDHEELVPQLLTNLHVLPFESRKHTTAILSYMLVAGLEGEDAVVYLSCMKEFVNYIETRFDELMTIIVNGHELSKHGASDVVLHFGTLFRSCLRHNVLFQHLTSSRNASRYLYPFLDNYVHVPNFDVSSDAMATLRAIFTTSASTAGTKADREQLVAEFLTRDYVPVFDERFNPKLLTDSANYMTRRVALQILSTVLLTRSNYSVMILYVASRTNLVLVMKLLRDNSPHITWDAFHVFKVFVANPNKPPEVVKILHDNQVREWDKAINLSLTRCYR